MSIYKRYTTTCLLCKSEVSNSNFNRHYKSKQCNFGGATKCVGQAHDTLIRSKKLSWKSDIRTCPVCNTDYTPTHKRQYRCSEKCKHKFTEIRKHNMSITMKDVVLKHAESYAGKYNRGNAKGMTCSNGMQVIGSWEYSFVEYCIKNKIEITQPIEPFEYTWNGTRQYYPDFYLPTENVFIEVKGMKTDRDIAKWKALTLHETLIVIDKSTIYKIKDNSIVPNDLWSRRLELNQ